MKTNRVIFEYQDQIIVSNNVDEVKGWIDSFPGISCNQPTLNNLNSILNTEWVRWGAYNQNISPVAKGYRLECLKPAGISKGKINFLLTECLTVEQVLAERAAYAKRIEDAKEKTVDFAEKAVDKLKDWLKPKSKEEEK